MRWGKIQNATDKFQAEQYRKDYEAVQEAARHAVEQSSIKPSFTIKADTRFIGNDVLKSWRDVKDELPMMSVLKQQIIGELSNPIITQSESTILQDPTDSTQPNTLNSGDLKVVIEELNKALPDGSTWHYTALMVNDTIEQAIRDMYSRSVVHGAQQVTERMQSMALKAEKVGTDLPDSKYAPSQPEDTDTPMKVPNCPDHGTKLEYNPERGMWQCKHAGCRKIARPAQTRVERRNSPQMLESDIEIVAMETNEQTPSDECVVIEGGRKMKVYLRLKKYNALLEVTKYFGRMLVNASDMQSATVNLHLKDLPVVSFQEGQYK